MPYYVYIIQSAVDNSYYKGFTENLLQRLALHNSGESTYTRRKIPWLIVYIEVFESKRESLIREKALKKYDHAQIQRLLTSPKNKIKEIGL
jgi:putative endonuclease